MPVKFLLDGVISGRTLWWSRSIHLGWRPCPCQGVTAHGGPRGLCSLPALEASLGRQPLSFSCSKRYRNHSIVRRIFHDVDWSRTLYPGGVKCLIYIAVHQSKKSLHENASRSAPTNCMSAAVARMAGTWKTGSPPRANCEMRTHL